MAAAAAKAACMAKCDEIGCGCVAVSANDPGTSANPDAECPKARCALAMDPGTYTVGSWGKTNYDGRGYKSYNNKATPPQMTAAKYAQLPGYGFCRAGGAGASATLGDMAWAIAMALARRACTQRYSPTALISTFVKAPHQLSFGE